MQACSCSIFDVRKEQILEASGSAWIQLVCNVCGSILDSKQVAAEDGRRERRPPWPPHEERNERVGSQVF